MNNERDNCCKSLQELLEPYIKALNEYKKSHNEIRTINIK